MIKSPKNAEKEKRISAVAIITNFPYGIEFPYGVEWPASGIEVPDRPPRVSHGRVCPCFPRPPP